MLAFHPPPLPLTYNTASQTILPLATAIESAAFTSYPPQKGDPSPAYRAKMRSLFQNLKGKTSAGLRSDVLTGNIAPADFVVLTEEELQSPERRAQIEEIKKQNMNDAQAPKEEKSISTAFTCGRCKKKRVSYTQAQTRSAVCSFLACCASRMVWWLMAYRMSR